MRKKLALLLGFGLGLALAALLRRRRARRAAPAGAEPVAPPSVDPRAAQLRRKLEETREAQSAPPPEPGGDLDAELARERERVYGEARTTLDEMRNAGL
jgi:hypothetical protein